MKLAAPLQFRVVEKALKHLNPASGLNFEAWQAVREGLQADSFRHSLPKDIDLAAGKRGIRLFKK